jgi:hypothetical protein
MSGKWQDFYNRNFTPWDSGKPEPHLVAAFVARAKQLGVSVSISVYSSDEDEDTQASTETSERLLENDIFEQFSKVRGAP